MKIVFVGGGNMTRAIVTGLTKTGFAPEKISVIDRNESKRQFFATQLHCQVAATVDASLASATMLVLAIKPQGAESYCRGLQALQQHQPLIMSVLAGVTVNTLQEWFKYPLSIVRAMPNTPALIQAGATGLFANAQVTSHQKKQVEQIMQAIGIYAWLEDEQLLDVITALSGSGPAYYFYIIELMQQIAVDMGLPSEIARAFSLQTACGAAKMALKSTEPVSALRAHVTSKKGATEAAIQCMQDNGLKALLAKSLNACRERAKVLGKG